MLINKNGFKVDGIDFAQYLENIDYGRPFIWGTDAGRNNLAGTYTGTLIGKFPKFTLHFRPLTKEELEYITPYLEEAQQEITYYSNKLKRFNTISTYSGDYTYSNKNTLDNVNENEPFDISFIARAKE